MPAILEIRQAGALALPPRGQTRSNGRRREKRVEGLKRSENQSEHERRSTRLMRQDARRPRGAWALHGESATGLTLDACATVAG